jgi:hypothetical protein
MTFTAEDERLEDARDAASDAELASYGWTDADYASDAAERALIGQLKRVVRRGWTAR